MAGVIPGKAFRTPASFQIRLCDAQSEKAGIGCENLGAVPAHEFHYFDSENCGKDFLAQKPGSNRSWNCIHGTEKPACRLPSSLLLWKPKGTESVSEAVRRVQEPEETDGRGKLLPAEKLKHQKKIPVCQITGTKNFVINRTACRYAPGRGTSVRSLFFYILYHWRQVFF